MIMRRLAGHREVVSLKSAAGGEHGRVHNSLLRLPVLGSDQLTRRNAIMPCAKKRMI